MIVGSTLGFELHLAAGHGRQALLKRVDAIGRQRHGRRQFGAHHFRVLHQARLVRLRHLGQQRQPVALRQHQQDLREDRRDLAGLREQLLDNAALAGGGNRRIHQDARQPFVAGDELREPRKLAPNLLDVGFLRRHVEERLRVSLRGAAAGHRASFSCDA